MTHVLLHPGGAPETRYSCTHFFLSVNEVEVCIYMTASSVLVRVLVKPYTYT